MRKNNVDFKERTLAKLQLQNHEFTRHLQTIQAMLYLDEIESAKKYLNEISKNNQTIKNWVDVGHPVLTVQLNQKKHEAEIKGINFVFSVSNHSEINIKTNDLCSIVGNLIDNSFDAVTGCREPKNVEVKIGVTNVGYTIYVSNNGPPISKQLQKKILTPGFTTKGYKSRGYGLNVVKKIIDRYNGTIQIISEERTTFSVIIPKIHNMPGINK